MPSGGQRIIVLLAGSRGYVRPDPRPQRIRLPPGIAAVSRAREASGTPAAETSTVPADLSARLPAGELFAPGLYYPHSATALATHMLRPHARLPGLRDPRDPAARAMQRGQPQSALPAHHLGRGCCRHRKHPQGGRRQQRPWTSDRCVIDLKGRCGSQGSPQTMSLHLFGG